MHQRERLLILREVEPVRDEPLRLDPAVRHRLERGIPIIPRPGETAVPRAADDDLLAQDLPVRLFREPHLPLRIAERHDRTERLGRRQAGREPLRGARPLDAGGRAASCGEALRERLRPRLPPEIVGEKAVRLRPDDLLVAARGEENIKDPRRFRPLRDEHRDRADAIEQQRLARLHPREQERMMRDRRRLAHRRRLERDARGQEAEILPAHRQIFRHAAILPRAIVPVVRTLRVVPRCTGGAMATGEQRDHRRPPPDEVLRLALRRSDDLARELMPDDRGEMVRPRLKDPRDVTPADPCRANTQQHLARLRHRHGHIIIAQIPNAIQVQRLHPFHHCQTHPLPLPPITFPSAPYTLILFRKESSA